MCYLFHIFWLNPAIKNFLIFSNAWTCAIPNPWVNLVYEMSNRIDGNYNTITVISNDIKGLLTI